MSVPDQDGFSNVCGKKLFVFELLCTEYACVLEEGGAGVGLSFVDILTVVSRFFFFSTTG